RVAVIPGSTFGLTAGCCLRIAYGALELPTAAEALARFTRGLRGICG
ncbi:MAG TPA: pyridoxal phosphate-dependent aminotransferase, partial [Phycisphaerae bacterium]|nr:pyridoxal phosphate-dependent aminotransferase [Phycisphaerae bacterium]